MNPQYMHFLMAQVGLAGERYDAKYTAALSRELEYIESELYNTLYPEYKSKMLMPVSHKIPEGAESWTYRQWDMFGVANIIANYADDLPLVDVMKEEYTGKIQSFGDAYHVSVQDLAGAAFSGIRIDNERGQAARQAIENKIDIIGAEGVPMANLHGLLDLPNVPLVSPITGAWDTATVATGPEIIADLNKLVDDTISTNRETVIPDTLILDDINYRYANSKPYSTNSPKSALKVFLENSEYITNVYSWQRCRTADAARTGPRFMCYKRAPRFVSYEIPMEFKQLPPQARSLAFIINCYCRVAGVSCKYPLGASYMDGC